MIRDIMIHVDGSSQDEIRLAHGEALAQAFKAHLTGLFVNCLPGFAISADAAGTGAVYMAELMEEAMADGDRVADDVKRRLDRVSVPHDMLRIDAVPDNVGRQASVAARYADLFLAVRPSAGSDEGMRWMSLVEGVLFGSSRGVCLVPDGRRAGPIKRVVIGWNGSREAARAVAEAMPFLRKATKVVVLKAERDPGEDDLDTRLARHLDRHGVEATLHDVRSRDPADAIIAEASAIEADMIVIGAYGHSRLREWALGGVTRDLLLRSPLPLLLAH
jgi:nucleotide-binding universal stress UspA family protein